MAASEHKLVVLGAGGVGKSALTIMYVKSQFVEQYDATIEDIYRKTVSVDDFPCMLDILDTAGQEEYSVMRDGYFRHGEGFFLVYSVTSRASFQEVIKLRAQIMRVKEDSGKIPIILVGNKCDLEDNRQVLKNEGEDLARSWKVPFFETSAKMRINVENSFCELVREIRRPVRGQPIRKTKKKSGQCTML